MYMHIMEVFRKIFRMHIFFLHLDKICLQKVDPILYALLRLDVKRVVQFIFVAILITLCVYF